MQLKSHELALIYSMYEMKALAMNQKHGMHSSTKALNNACSLGIKDNRNQYTKDDVI